MQARTDYRLSIGGGQTQQSFSPQIFSAKYRTTETMKDWRGRQYFQNASLLLYQFMILVKIAKLIMHSFAILKMSINYFNIIFNKNSGSNFESIEANDNKIFWSSIYWIQRIIQIKISFNIIKIKNQQCMKSPEFYK